MIRLYIEGQEIELDKTVQFAITKQFEELSNPTVIINDWSKTVSIPFTLRNHQIFGHIYSPDKAIVGTTGNSYIGINFDPLRKLDFRLEWDNAILMTGYAKMIDIKRSKGTGTYNITLNGQLGKIFQEMKKITFDIEAPESEDKYIIRGAQYVNTAIDKDLVYDSWRSAGQVNSILNKSGDSRYNINDIIGFAPNNSFCEDFDYKTYQPNSTTSETFTNTLGDAFKTATGIDGDTVIPNGMLPREIGEYRSYYQLPYVYWNKLFQMFQEKTEEVTGYTFDLDESWFNEANPYWYYLVYMLKPLFQSNSTALKGEEIENNYAAFDRKKHVFSYDDKSDVSNKKLYVSAYDNSYNISYNAHTYSDEFTYSINEDKNVTYNISGTTYTSPEVHKEITNPYPSSSFTSISEDVAMYDSNNIFQFNDKYVYAKATLNLQVLLQSELPGDIQWTSGVKTTGGGTTGNHTIPPQKSVVYTKDTTFNPNSMLILDVIFKSTSDNREYVKKILIAHNAVKNYSGDNTSYRNIWNYIQSNPDAIVQYLDTSNVTRTYDSTNNKTIYTKQLNITTPEFNLTNILLSNRFNISYKAYWFNPMQMPFYGGVGSNGTRFSKYMYDMTPFGTGTKTNIAINTGVKYETTVDTTMSMRLHFTNNTKHYSGDTFIFNDLWNNEYNLFDEILKYCKMFRINISVDDVNKKIIFQRTKKLFSNYAVKDWTDKLDMSKDCVIKPITFDKKYALFNYKDSKTYLAEEYKKKYGLNFGEYKLITDYNFNTDTENLFKNVKTSIINTDNVLSWENLFNRHVIEYSVPDELYVDCKNKDKKFEDVFGQFYFHNGLNTFNTENALHMREVTISDDTTLQKNTNTYFYNQGGETSKRIFVTTYPHLDIVRDDNMLLFNVPKYNFTYIENYNGKHALYYNLWNTYINERYNVQNKIVTCYLQLKPSDYSEFKWSNFIKIENQLYFVNKIYDYDITSSKSTKVDLITVQNIGAYTTDNYDFDYIVARPNFITIPYDYYKKITIYSTTPWEYYDSGDVGDFITVYPQSGNAGETDVIIGSINENSGYTATFLQIDPTTSETINEINVVCEVGGNSTIIVDEWYYQLLPGTSSSFTITSETVWKLIKTVKSGNNNTRLNMTTGFAGAVTVTITAGSTGTGRTDFYIENAGGDIVMIRADVQQSEILVMPQNVTLSAGSQSATVEVHCSANSWSASILSGSSDVTVSPTSGGNGVTSVTVTSGSTTGVTRWRFSSPNGASTLKINVV